MEDRDEFPGGIVWLGVILNRACRSETRVRNALRFHRRRSVRVVREKIMGSRKTVALCIGIVLSHSVFPLRSAGTIFLQVGHAMIGYDCFSCP